MTPYYADDHVTLYHGNAAEIAPTLGAFGTVMTDPPYPGYVKGWEVPDVTSILLSIDAQTLVVFWPVLTPAPLPDLCAEHVWEKPNGQSLYHFERILVFGAAAPAARIYRQAAILPNYVQYAAEATDHPTQKPVKLMRRLLAHYPSEPVLDPFAGSGTTLVAAKDMGIKAVGIELNERWCEVAANRLRQEVLGLVA